MTSSHPPLSESLVLLDSPIDLGPVEDESDIPIRNSNELELSPFFSNFDLVNIDSLHDSPSDEDILNAVLPPLEYIDPLDGHKYRQYVSTQKSNRLYIVSLMDKLNKILCDTRAQKGGICIIRERIFFSLFDEIIRQVILENVSQGLLLNQIKNHYLVTIDSYKYLFNSSVIYSANAQCKADDGTAEKEEEINRLHDLRNSLESELSTLKSQIEMETKLIMEKRTLVDAQRKEVCDFLRNQNSQLEAFLKRDSK